MIYVSLLVHEKPDVILDQIANFKKYFGVCELYIHVSQSFDGDFSQLRNSLEEIGGVFVNPVRLNTSWGDVLNPHVVNLREITKKIEDSDIVTFHSSNDLLIRPGVMRFFDIYDCGYISDDIKMKHGKDVSAVKNDKVLSKILDELSSKRIIWSQIEGLFMRGKHLRKIMPWLERYSIETKEGNRGFYAEEVVIASLLDAIITPEDRVGTPYVYSEISISEKIFGLLGKNLLGRAVNALMKKTGLLQMHKSIVRSILDEGFLSKFLISENSMRNERAHVYGVKRVRRTIDDPLRVFIRSL